MFAGTTRIYISWTTRKFSWTTRIYLAKRGREWGDRKCVRLARRHPAKGAGVDCNQRRRVPGLVAGVRRVELLKVGEGDAGVGGRAVVNGVGPERDDKAGGGEVRAGSGAA